MCGRGCVNVLAMIVSVGEVVWARVCECGQGA